MSEPTATNGEGHGNDTSRPQTVLLTKLRQENQSFEEDASIGEAFFSKQNDGAVDNNDNNDDNLTSKAQVMSSQAGHDDADHSDTENGANSPKVRPKTVTKHRTDGYQQKLVDIGAIGSTESKSTQVQTPLSPKPKSEKCYICGKEFLLSSLKIHEKQCMKKHEAKTSEAKTSKANNKTSSAAVSKVSKKPQLEACYLCGKEFFVHSLGIHETQCIKNWKANKTPDAKDQPISERTMSEKKRKDYEEESTADVSQEKEQKSTKKEATKGQNDSAKLEKKIESPGLKQKGLKTIPCYLCGVAFLPHSLKIHEKKCQGQSRDTRPIERNSNMAEKVDLGLNSATGAEVSTEELPEGAQNETNSKNMDDAKHSSNTYIAKKPKTIVCYICGQEFLKSSYTFHEKKCASANENSTVEETPLEKNKVSNPRNSTKPKTIICYICGEEFLKSSYAFHEKKCTKVTENVEEKSSETTKANLNSSKTSPKPRTIVCYICGQEFLKSSYPIHEKQCASRDKKVEDLESQKEKTAAFKASSAGKGKPSSDLQMERPETPRRKPKTQTCYICGKEMLLSSLKVHEQQCQKKTDILKNINQQKSQRAAGRQRSGTPAKPRSEAKPKTDVCYVCGETFLSSSIKVHEAQCEKRWNEKNT